MTFSFLLLYLSFGHPKMSVCRVRGYNVWIKIISFACIFPCDEIFSLWDFMETIPLFEKLVIKVIRSKIL